MRKHSYTLVDVFTDRPLAGNPLAVFTDGEGLADDRMQALARELNLSETVFLQRASEGGTARARIFTPWTELPFAGHPVLGTAFVIGRSTPLATVHLETGMGVIAVEIERDGGFVTRCVMTQPAPTFAPGPERAVVAAALGCDVLADPVVASNGPTHLIVAVPAVATLAPDLAALAALGTATVACHAPPADGAVDVRVFAPGVGVPEDPATGSAAGPLAAHLLATGAIAPGMLLVRQGDDMGRPSRIEVTVEPGAPPRVGGSCVPVARGFFEL